MGVYLSSEADADLDRIFEYIRHRSPQNADEFLGRVEEALARIEKAPFLARLRDDDLPIPGLRFGNADPAVLIYRALDNGDVEVVRVAHKRQDFPTLFAPLEDDAERDA